MNYFCDSVLCVIILTRGLSLCEYELCHVFLAFLLNLFPEIIHGKKESVATQWCLSLWDPMDCSPPGFSVCGIFQARILKWVAISFSRGSSRPRDRIWDSCIMWADSLPSGPPGKPEIIHTLPNCQKSICLPSCYFFTYKMHILCAVLCKALCWA